MQQRLKQLPATVLVQVVPKVLKPPFKVALVSKQPQKPFLTPQLQAGIRSPFQHPNMEAHDSHQTFNAASLKGSSWASLTFYRCVIPTSQGQEHTASSLQTLSQASLQNSLCLSPLLPSPQAFLCSPMNPLLALQTLFPLFHLILQSQVMQVRQLMLCRAFFALFTSLEMGITVPWLHPTTVLPCTRGLSPKGWHPKGT